MPALALLLAAGPARAGLLGVEAQLQYNLLETKIRGQQASGSGRFSTSYNLYLKRPLLAGSSLTSNLNVNSSETGEANGRQSNRNINFDLYARQPKYTFIGRVSRSDSGGSGGGRSSNTNTNYNASLFLQEPAYPVVNLQFLRNIATSGSGVSNAATTTYLLSSYYDAAPFRFSYDRTQQTQELASTFNTQTSSVTMNHTLMTGLTVSGEISKSSIRNLSFIPGVNSATSNNSLTRLIRLTATPTRAIAASLDYSARSNDILSGGRPSNNDNASLGATIRADILPGLSLDYSNQLQTQHNSPAGNGSSTTSRDSRTGISARLSEDAVISASLTHTESDRSLGSASSEDTMQLATQIGLTPRTDLSLDLGRNKAATDSASGYDSTFMGISIRDRSTDKLSLGIGYRRNAVDSTLVGSAPFTQRTDSLDLDASWVPTYDLGINFRLSCQANNGSSISQVLVPAVNVRWQLDSATNLSVNYGWEKNQLWQAAAGSVSNQLTMGTSFRVTHGFTNGSSLDLSYDFSSASLGELEWQRQVRVYFTTRH